MEPTPLISGTHPRTYALPMASSAPPPCPLNSATIRFWHAAPVHAYRSWRKSGSTRWKPLESPRTSSPIPPQSLLMPRSASGSTLAPNKCRAYD
eukprot:scaffold224040_cov31-Tisochrysis_lutea.AAC.3